MIEAPPLVEFRDAAFAYSRGGPAVEADLIIPRGAMVGLLGPSGAGKTTLLRAVLGQVRPVRGEVRIAGEPLRGRLSHRVGYVPQLETIDWNFPLTVAEAVLLGRVTESGPWPWPRRRDRADMEALLDRLGKSERADAAAALGRVGMAAFAGRQISQLSGGQQQRVFLARALIRRPDLLLLDEPTSGVDVRTRQEILGLLRDLNDDGISIVLTTHDLNSVATTLPELVCVNRRVLAQGPPEAVFTPAVLRATFGSEMIVFRHDGVLLTADAPAHALEHPHHVHLHHGVPHDELESGRRAR